MGRQWHQFMGFDVDCGRDAAFSCIRSAADLEACKRHCEDHGFGGFVYCKGEVFFKEGSAADLGRKSFRRSDRQVTLHLGFSAYEVQTGGARFHLDMVSKGERNNGKGKGKGKGKGEWNRGSFQPRLQQPHQPPTPSVSTKDSGLVAEVANDNSCGKDTPTGKAGNSMDPMLSCGGDASLEAPSPSNPPLSHELMEGVPETRHANSSLETCSQKAPQDEYWQECWCSRSQRFFFYNTITHNVSWHTNEEIQRHLDARRTWENEHKELLSLGPFVRTTDVAVDALISFADVDSQSVLLDVGCGDGEVLRRFTREKRCRGIGLDINPFLHREAVRLGKKEKSLDFTNFRWMRAEDIEVNDPAFESVTHIFLFVLDIDCNEVLLRTLLHFVDQGARIITNTFELPSEHFTQISIWPDEDTLEGAFWFLTPPFTRLFMYGKSDGEGAPSCGGSQHVQIETVLSISDKAKVIVEEVQRKLSSSKFDVGVDKLELRLLAAIQEVIERHGHSFFDRERYSHLTIVIIIAFLTQEYDVRRLQDEYPHLLSIVMGVLRTRFPDVVLRTALMGPEEEADLDSASQRLAGKDTSCSPGDSSCSTGDTSLNENEVVSFCSTGDPIDAELLVEKIDADD